MRVRFLGGASSVVDAVTPLSDPFEPLEPFFLLDFACFLDTFSTFPLLLLLLLLLGRALEVCEE